MTRDIIIIGGGPGGYVAAIRAAQLGKSVVLIEDDALGGVCLNWGCIPTKALLSSAKKAVQGDLGAMVDHSRGVSSKLRDGVSYLMSKNKVEVIKQRADVLLDARHVRLCNGDVLEANLGIIIATGARNRVLEGIDIDGKVFWNASHAMTARSIPKDLLVIGSGAIGIEFASFYNMLGSKVTVIEKMGTILPSEDAEISACAKKAFEKRGVRFITSANVESIEEGRACVNGNMLHFDNAIVAIGIIGNTDVARGQLDIDKGHIVTNGFCETSKKGVYAIGDVTIGPWLAHKASHEGVIAVEHLCGHKVRPIKRANIPGCTYSEPQIASVGLTEEKAKALGKVRVGRFSFASNGQALATGHEEGMVKMIFDDSTGELLGSHMIGHGVTELIHSMVIAKELEATDEELAHMIFPHPTLSEAIHEAVLDAMGRPLHK